VRVEHDVGRTALVAQLDVLTSVCDGLDDVGLLAASRCHGWTVGDVLVHVHLGLQDLLLALVSPTTAPPDVDAAGYWNAPKGK